MTKTATLAKFDTIAEHAATVDAFAHQDLPDLLQALRMLRDTADSALVDVVRDARAQGMSWDEIGRWTGVTKQAAQQRYGPV